MSFFRTSSNYINSNQNGEQNENNFWPSKKSFNHTQYFDNLSQSIKNLELSDEWFNSNSLRKLIFESKNMADIPFKYRATIAWGICHNTAPLILTLLAPLESYKAKIPDIIKTVSGNRNETNGMQEYLIFQQVKKLPEALLVTLADDQCCAFVCNLNNNLHSFIIEKRGKNSFYLYQSYFGNFNTKGYNLTQFLDEKSTRQAFTYDELIEKLSLVLGTKVKEYDFEQINGAYQDLFHIKMPTRFEPYSFSFIPTDPYQGYWNKYENSTIVMNEQESELQEKKVLGRGNYL